MLLPPGPEQSSLMITLRRGWAIETAHNQSKTKKKRVPFFMDRIFREVNWSPVWQKFRAERDLPVCPEIWTGFARSEPQFQGELNQARVVHRVVDDPEGAGSIDILLPGAPGASQVELRMVEEIEKFGTELQVHAFPERNREVLHHREVGIHKARAVDRSSGSGAQLTPWGLREGAGIEPVLNGVDLRGAVGAASLRPGLVRVSHLVRTLERVSVIGKEHPGSVSAINDKQRKPRRGVFDHVQLPVAQDCIGCTAPVAAKVLALAKRQVVQNAGGKVVVEIELRHAPIQLAVTRQGIIQCPRIRAEAIGHAGVERTRPGIAEQGVEAVARALGLPLRLEGVVASPSHTIIGNNTLERCGIWVGREAATDGVAGNTAASSRRTQILVGLPDQNAGTAGA